MSWQVQVLQDKLPFGFRQCSWYELVLTLGVRGILYRELLKSSLFVLFSRNQLRNSVLQKSSLFGFPQAECRICDDVLFLTHYFAHVAFRLVFAWKHSGILLLKCCVALRFGFISNPFFSAIIPPCFQAWHGAWSFSWCSGAFGWKRGFGFRFLLGDSTKREREGERERGEQLHAKGTVRFCWMMQAIICAGHT